MTISSSNIGINAIWTEANTGSIGNNVSVSDLFKKSYFEGPGGTNSISYNAWGQYGSTTGADIIYGLSSANTNLNFGAYSGKTYFYDNSSFKCAVRINNASTPIPPPPPPPAPPVPPSANDVMVEVKIYDSTGTYVYMSLMPSQTQPNYNQTFDLSSSGGTPMINYLYWEVLFGTDQG